MNWRKNLNLNSYEWWRNHRRVVTFGGFIFIFCWWLNPVIQEARNKQTCINIFEKEIKARGEKTDSKYLSKEEEAFAIAFTQCKS